MGERQAAVEQLLVEVPPGAAPDAPRVDAQRVERHCEAGQAAEGRLVLGAEVLNELEEALQRAIQERFAKQPLACVSSANIDENQVQQAACW